MSAVTVPAEAIITFLQSKGFVERKKYTTVGRGGGQGIGSEIVYERPHKVDSRYKVLVYTSIRRGAANARGVGQDAIRVCAIYEDATSARGICKLPRVHRTGTVEGVLARMLERMREAYQRCCDARPKQPRRRCLPRTPEGRINNCSLNNGETEADCQVCLGTCPDRAHFTSLGMHFDAVQQKHHPGSFPVGRERSFLDGAESDDEIEEP